MSFYNYQNDSIDYYAYHDIDMHKEEIKRNIAKDHMENYRYAVMVRKDILDLFELAPDQCMLPGYSPMTKIRVNKVFGDSEISSPVLTVIYISNSIVNEFCIALHPKIQTEMGLDFDGDIVRIEEV